MLTYNDVFLKACRKESVPFTPVWYMRQAGRHQAEYRKIRESYTLMDICKHPELCAEVTILPIDQFGVDAAILFSDIMIPIEAMGVGVEIRGGYGPVIANPVQTMNDVNKLNLFHPEEKLPATLETIRILKRELQVPLIGFAGAPFTLASYLVEGGPSRNYHKTKQMMFANPTLWQALMDKLADMIVVYMKAQVENGASAVQIFDSWIGALSPAHYRTYVFPTMKRIFQELRTLAVPTIYFGVNTGELLQTFGELEADVIGVDWKVPLLAANQRVGGRHALQGNLDPALLIAPWEVIQKEVEKILDEGMQLKGHVFNLGHGLYPEVSGDVLKRLTEFVHHYSMRTR